MLAEETDTSSSDSQDGSDVQQEFGNCLMQCTAEGSRDIQQQSKSLYQQLATADPHSTGFLANAAADAKMPPAPQALELAENEVASLGSAADARILALLRTASSLGQKKMRALLRSEGVFVSQKRLRRVMSQPRADWLHGTYAQSLHRPNLGLNCSSGTFDAGPECRHSRLRAQTDGDVAERSEAWPEHHRAAYGRSKRPSTKLRKRRQLLIVAANLVEEVPSVGQTACRPAAVAHEALGEGDRRSPDLQHSRSGNTVLVGELRQATLVAKAVEDYLTPSAVES